MRLPWLRVEVTGQSMLPALAPGEWLLVRRGVTPRPGAIVVVAVDGRRVVKRLTRVTADGRYWVEGDNAAVSTDSRTYGAVPRAAILGEVRWRVRPLRWAGRVR